MLDNFGIKDVALQWFHGYLSGRRQIVEIKQTVDGTTISTRSASREVTRGVPQGSVLGPVLFILFTCDLSMFMEPYSQTVMFADDTVLITNNKNAKALEIATYIAVNMAHDYCIANDLVFNERKTTQMILGKLKDNISATPNIANVNQTKHLGVILDDRLSWDAHIESLSLKLNTSLYRLY
uniref:Reverse transcriptase domain-containing protein n=1 Tax=Graphocephala atropunctata TaxID=36148 RepID=A0A1B6KVB4_9HEMI